MRDVRVDGCNARPVRSSKRIQFAKSSSAVVAAALSLITIFSSIPGRASRTLRPLASVRRGGRRPPAYPSSGVAASTVPNSSWPSRLPKYSDLTGASNARRSFCLLSPRTLSTGNMALVYTLAAALFHRV